MQLNARSSPEHACAVSRSSKLSTTSWPIDHSYSFAVTVARGAVTAARPTARLRYPSESGPPRGDAKSVAVGVHKVAFSSGQPILIDRNSELRRHGINVPDVEVDQGV